MNPLPLDILDTVGLVGFVAGIVLVVRTPSGERGPLSTGAKAFAIAAASVYVLVMLSDLLDRVGVHSVVDVFERPLEQLFIPLVLVTVYSALVRQQLNDTHDTYEGLLRTGDMMIRAIESTPAGTVWIDTDGRIAFANPAARRMLGLDDSAVGLEQEDFDWVVRIGSSQTMRASVGRDFSALVGREPLVDVSIVIEHPPHPRRRFSVNTSPTLSPDGRLEGVIASFLDKEPWRVLQS